MAITEENKSGKQTRYFSELISGDWLVAYALSKKCFAGGDIGGLRQMQSQTGFSLMMLCWRNLYKANETNILEICFLEL
jgi:hypothetical protein